MGQRGNAAWSITNWSNIGGLAGQQEGWLARSVTLMIETAIKTAFKKYIMWRRHEFHENYEIGNAPGYIWEIAVSRVHLLAKLVPPT